MTALLSSNGKDADRLPCGVRVDDLLAQVADGASTGDAAHQQACAHCRAALAELADLWAPVAEGPCPLILDTRGVSTPRLAA